MIAIVSYHPQRKLDRSILIRWAGRGAPLTAALMWFNIMGRGIRAHNISRATRAGVVFENGSSIFYRRTARLNITRRAHDVVDTANEIETILSAPRSLRTVLSNQEDLAMDPSFPLCGVVLGRCKDASNQTTRTLGSFLSIFFGCRAHSSRQYHITLYPEIWKMGSRKLRLRTTRSL